MTKGHNPISICLFFTYPLSLQNWNELGLFDREVLLYKKIADRGIRVAFFTYGDEGDLEFKEKLLGIEIIPAYSGRKRPRNKVAEYLYSLVLPFRFRKKLSTYSIMKTNQMMGAWIPLLASWLTGKRLLVRSGFEFYSFCCKKNLNPVRKMAAYFLSRIVYSLGKYIVITSHKDGKFISKTFNVPEKKIEVISNYIDTELFVPLQSEQIYDDRVVYVGRINPQKNLYNLIEACAISKVGLDIIGSEDDKSPLATHAREYGADVRFLGVLSNRKIAEILASYRIFILPSIYEGNPKSLLEAMSCGKAVIGTEVDGIREIIRNEENGLLCGTNADSLADSINRLLYNPELCNRLGEAAREYILMTCSLGIIVERELDIYKSILDNEKSR